MFEVAVDDVGGCPPNAEVGGGMPSCGGNGIEVGGCGADVCSGWKVSPALGGGGTFLLNGVGAAPGCGGGGPSASLEVILVGCKGAYRCAAVPVGAGKAEAPGRAGG